MPAPHPRWDDIWIPLGYRTYCHNILFAIQKCSNQGWGHQDMSSASVSTSNLCPALPSLLPGYRIQDNKLGLTASLLAGRAAKCLLPPRPPLKGWVVKVLSNPQAAGQPAKSRDLTSPYCSQRYIPSTGLHAMPALIDRNYRGKEMFIYCIIHLYLLKS